MKLKLIILLLISLLVAESRSVIGEYYNHFGQRITIKADSTFKYEWSFDLAGGWATGKWKIKNDTIYFKVIPIYDTLRIAYKKDTLLLSIDEKPNLITDATNSLAYFVSSGRQDIKIMNDKLYFKSDKLYEINKRGKLITKKRSFWKGGKDLHDPWFIKKVSNPIIILKK